MDDLKNTVTCTGSLRLSLEYVLEDQRLGNKMIINEYICIQILYITENGKKSLFIFSRKLSRKLLENFQDFGKITSNTSPILSIQSWSHSWYKSLFRSIKKIKNYIIKHTTHVMCLWKLYLFMGSWHGKDLFLYRISIIGLNKSLENSKGHLLNPSSVNWIKGSLPK